jgi:hypothetical protein
MHSCTINWRQENFSQFFGNLSEAHTGLKIICCQEGQLDSCRAVASGKNTLVFSPELLHEIVSAEHDCNVRSIGHCRNLLMAASILVGESEPAVFVDDDVFPDSHVFRSFAAAFGRYDLVHGKYSGDIANGLQLAVCFFGLLEEGCASGWKNANEIGRCLRGKHPQSALWGAGAALQSAPGGLMGISARLKCAMPFVPTEYRLEDHFFEFYSRFSLPSFAFMDETVPQDLSPIARHSRKEGSADELVSGYALELRSSVAEKYLYFRLSGFLPKIIGGRHRLVRASEFDPEETARAAAAEGALQKMQAAAGFYISKRPPQEISAQLERFLALSWEDFFVPQEKLDGLLSDFRAEQKWFFGIVNSPQDEKTKLGKNLLALKA